MSTLEERRAIMTAALNKVCKWRQTLAGWQLGMRSTEDPESNAVRDTRELLIVLRVELNALTGLLMKSGAITEADWCDAVAEEAAHYDAGFERRFPGFSTSQGGVDVDVRVAAETMKRYRFKP